MNTKTFDDFWTENKPHLVALLKELQPTIEDSFRASDDYEDTTPGIQITISINEDCTQWSYQTGDNSYTGGCYSHPFWGVSELHRDSNVDEVAEYLIEDLASVIDDWTE